MKRLRGLGFAAILISAPLAAAAQDVSGRYVVEGRNFDGSRYRGKVTITVTSKNTCRIEWNVGTVWKGICMRNGTNFAASYFAGQAVGLIIYQIRPDGRMEGLWTIADQDGVGTETLIPE